MEEGTDSETSARIGGRETVDEEAEERSYEERESEWDGGDQAEEEEVVVCDRLGCWEVAVAAFDALVVTEGVVVEAVVIHEMRLCLDVSEHSCVHCPSLRNSELHWRIALLSQTGGVAEVVVVV